MVVDLDENRSKNNVVLLQGTRAKAKARGMVWLIKDQHFWLVLAVYVSQKTFHDRVANCRFTGGATS